jgi:ribonuclease/clavin/mitogillin
MASMQGAEDARRRAILARVAGVEPSAVPALTALTPRSKAAPSTVTTSLVGIRLPDVERLSERVLCVQGLNPSAFTGPGTNTYIVGSGQQRVLIDAGDPGVPAYVNLLARTLHTHCDGATISKILITHSHPDHIGGARAVAQRCGTPGTGCIIQKVPWPGQDAGLSIVSVVDGEVITVDDRTTLRAHHTPGHAPDHVCWELVEERALFSGDTVLGAGTVIVPVDGGSMRDYFGSLRRLLCLASKASLQAIHPGHGPSVHTPEQVQRILAEYIQHREQREAQALDALRASGRGKCAAELVSTLYADRRLSTSVRQAATETIFNHLVHLSEMGRVKQQHPPPPAHQPHQRVEWLGTVWVACGIGGG